MKTLLKIIVLVLINTQLSYGQYPVLTTTNLANNPTSDSNFMKNGNYGIDTNNERDQFVGLWKYETTDLIFELKIEKRDQYLNKIDYPQFNIFEYYYMDLVIFKYKLVKNNVVIFDNLNSNIPNETTNASFLSTATKHEDRDFLSGLLVDHTRNVCASVIVKKINTSGPEKINFDLSSGTYFLLNDISYYVGSDIKLFNIPTDGITMIKY